MNIFYLDKDPRKAATDQCDKHVVKMIVETAQILCTAHRYLDGLEYIAKTSNNRNIKRYQMNNGLMDRVLYKATHVNHPSCIWTRESSENYLWLYEHFGALCTEYFHRYGREHLTQTKLRAVLSILPKNIKRRAMTPMKLAMPDEYRSSDAVESYRNYYVTKQLNFKMAWTKSKAADWFVEKSKKVLIDDAIVIYRLSHSRTTEGIQL